MDIAGKERNSEKLKYKKPLENAGTRKGWRTDDGFVILCIQIYPKSFVVE